MAAGSSCHPREHHEQRQGGHHQPAHEVDLTAFRQTHGRHGTMPIPVALSYHHWTRSVMRPPFHPTMYTPRGLDACRIFPVTLPRRPFDPVSSEPRPLPGSVKLTVNANRVRRGLSRDGMHLFRGVYVYNCPWWILVCRPYLVATAATKCRQRRRLGDK